MTESIHIINDSEDNFRAAIFQKNYATPTLGLVPWHIRPIPIGGNARVDIPAAYSVYVNFGNEKDPTGGTQTQSVDIGGFEARITASPAHTTDHKEVVPVLRPQSTGIVTGEIHVQSTLPYGCWVHITKQGKDVFPSVVLVPNQTVMADVRPTFYIAIVNVFVMEGSRLREEELSSVSHPLIAEGTVTVTGSMWHGGYNFTDS